MDGRGPIKDAGTYTCGIPGYPVQVICTVLFVCGSTQEVGIREGMPAAAPCF